MRESTQEVVVESSDWFDEHTSHGMLVLAYQHAASGGFFTRLAAHVTLRQKQYDYSSIDKLITLWASIVVGCDHTVQINTLLGPHEQALAALFGFERFPEQSSVNRTLRASTPQTVEQMRALNLDLLARRSRARRRRLQSRLRKAKVLFVDLDQRGLSVSGKHYELAQKGALGRGRVQRGYQLSLAFVGGAIGEVLDEYFDPGNTPAHTRVEPMLASVAALARAWKLPAERIVVRADAQYGTPAILAKIEAAGFGYLIKGISPARAKALARKVSERGFGAVSPRSNNEPRWAADLGQQTFVGRVEKGQQAPTITARTIVVKWQEAERAKGGRPGPSVRAKRAAEAQRRRDCFATLMTSLPAEVLTTREALDIYDDRATIERYFRDEQGALGARSVRTHTAAGAAVFQWLVAITNNLLQWMRKQYLAETSLKSYGVGRLIGQVFQIPARLIREGKRIRVILPERHLLTRALVAAFTASPDTAQPTLSRLST
jgi:hypothetical protein